MSSAARIAALKKKLGKRRLGAPLKEAALAKYEQQLGVKLPDEYRSFLLKIGDGGGGGALLALKDALENEKVRIDLPFPFTSDDQETDDSMGGAMVISDLSSDRTWLVLTGPLRGTLWASSDNGWKRLDEDFLEWFEAMVLPELSDAAPTKDLPDLPVDAAHLILARLGLTDLPADLDRFAKAWSVGLVVI